MLIGSHVIIYTTDADATRAFFRDTLGFHHVDAGEGWLIFALPPAEVGIHPDEQGGRHQLFLMCDDVVKTMADLTVKGVKFTQPVMDRGWGLVTAFEMPGAGEFWIYQPRHPMACQTAPKHAAAKAAGPKRPAAGKAKKKPKAVSGTTRRTGRKGKKSRDAKRAQKLRKFRRR